MRRPEVGIIALAMLASACAIPTDLPNWDVTWNLPMPDNNAMSIGIATFLPNGVDTINAGNPRVPVAFGVKVASAPSINRTLGVQCPTCPSATAPKPAFTAPAATSTLTLTAATALNTATLFTGSQIVLTLTNGFTFDPINPPGGTAGSITIAVNNGTTTLGSLALVGPTTTIPAGQSKQFTIALSGTIDMAQPITVTMTMDSPAGAVGQPVLMNPNQTFTATAVPTLVISAANVTIGAQTLNSSATPIDMSQIDSSIVNRIAADDNNHGAMYLTVTNPLTLGANATVTFRSPTGTPVAQQIAPITKNIVISPAANATTPNVATVTVSLTGNELRRMFGHDLESAFGGTTNAGSTTVTPAQKIAVSARIEVNFSIKEQKP